ncbi:hypothetical protein JCM8097_004357 [Rhodosporidiobolus ruineniae]
MASTSSALSPTASKTNSSSSSPRPRVAFLGPLGTYSHQAATDFFGFEVDLVPQARIADVFQATSSSSTAFGLVPLENSSFGPVAETMDSLRTTRLSARGMTSLRVGHALLGAQGRVGEGEVKRVYSHEQAIGQCRAYLASHYPSASILPVASTALAAQKAAQDLEALAICSLMCAEVYGLEVVDRDIQDSAANTTRFLALSLPDVPLPSKYPVKPTRVLDLDPEQ